jgi:hypothetical protein
VGKNTRLNLGQLQVSLTNKKSSLYPYPSDQITDRYQIPIPKLSSLTPSPMQAYSFVAFHDEAYPYTAYRCHSTGQARAYQVEMEGHAHQCCHRLPHRHVPVGPGAPLVQAPRDQARRRAHLPPHAVREHNLGQEREELAGIGSTNHISTRGIYSSVVVHAICSSYSCTVTWKWPVTTLVSRLPVIFCCFINFHWFLDCRTNFPRLGQPMKITLISVDPADNP